MEALAHVRQRARLVSAQVARAAEVWIAPALGSSWGVVAVGGFGREQLFPHSDTDLLILVDRPEAAVAAKDAIGAFLRELWDAGLKPSHSVRTPPECRQFDVNNAELTLSLLTQRLVAGSSAVYGELTDALPDFLRSQRRLVAAHLLALTAKRWAKYQHTIYHLEPDIKESPGGLRDLHCLEWLDLIRPGSQQETLAGLEAARDLLFALRWRLHSRAGRNDNRLLFDAQDELFPQPEAGMREYFRQARAVHREAVAAVEGANPGGGGLAQPFLDWRSRLSNAEFTVVKEAVLLRDPGALETDPGLIPRLLQFVGRHGFRLARDTERRLRELSNHSGWRPLSGASWEDLLGLLVLPHAGNALRAMQETGLLPHWIPDWPRIECLVTRDFYHRYTVDEHTLVTIESLEELAASKDEEGAPFRELLAEGGGLGLLRLAPLLHDIGKGGGDGRHEEHSAQLARRFLDRLEAPEEDRRMVLFLVEHHLELSALMTGRDLTDTVTLELAAHRIGTIERLRLLTLLTYADISGVHPGAITPWRKSQLGSAYRGLHREFTRELETDRIEAGAAAAGPLDAFLRGFPTRYPLVHSAGEIESHFQMARQVASAGVAVTLARRGGTWELTVITRDRPRLFADIAGALASFGMSILKAEAFGNREALVVDIWRFHDPLRRLELNPSEVQDLERLVTRAAEGAENVVRLLAGRRRSPPPARPAFEPVVAFDPSASRRATLLEVIAADRPGLLFDLATAIHQSGSSIDVVLVNTEGHRAIDVFYLTRDGGKLPADVQESLRRRLKEIAAGDFSGPQPIASR